MSPGLYDACGIAVVERDGAISQVRGDPEHAVSRGKLCRKCSIGYNGAYLDPGATNAPAASRRRQGRREVRAGLLGRCARGDRRAAASDRGDRRNAHGPERPLHGHLLAHRLLLSAAVLPPAGRNRGRPRHGLQQGRPRRARVRVRHLPGRIRSTDCPRLRVHTGVGRESVGFGAARTRPLAAGIAGPGDRGRPDPNPDGRSGRSPSPAVPRQRRRPGLCLAARDRPRRARRR